MSRSSPLQNRVTPDGAIIAIPERGQLMGNRGGRLHTQSQELTRARWRSKSWITCQLRFKGRQRQVMGNGYTELFFFDEATALAAGHRPCFECRRDAANAFATHWNAIKNRPGRARAAEMDTVLHRERQCDNELVQLYTLPHGSMFDHLGNIYLKHHTQVLLWTWQGYTAATLPHETMIRPLTPPSMRAVLMDGYTPIVHSSIASI